MSLKKYFLNIHYIKKVIIIILLALGVIIATLIVLYFLVIKSAIPIKIVPGARTMYTGYVKIEPISLSDLKTKLEEQGCHTYDYYEGETANQCRYETTVSDEKKNTLVIYPDGKLFELFPLFLREDKLWVSKDIPGPPDPDKFKEKVRQDVSAIGNIVQIKENTWKITDTKYPWDVIY